MLEVDTNKPIMVDENHMRKHRVMKRKLLQFITTHKEAQAQLDKAAKKIRILEKRNKQKQLNKPSNDMDISPMEEGEEEEENDDDDNDDDDDGDIEEGEGEEDEDEDEDELEDDDDEELDTLLTANSSAKRIARRRAPSLSEIKRDENGHPILPIQFGQVKLISLGTINHTDPAYHNERYIWPVGYVVERTYMSMIDPENQTDYICKIEAAEDDNGPIFIIQPKDDPDTILTGKTPTSCWGTVIKGANKVRRKSCRNAISGPEYFGFGNNVIRTLIEELENADKCEKYVSS
ncbi:F/Y rich C-terminus-domain-containing protein [Cunninghamella echinulata]|nr:F/Y rich C-terminus-domain-containing protein [Cunninghamella echinulata]